MDTLKRLIVEELEKENDPNGQIRILQKINKMVLTEYVVHIGDFTIEPLLAESYYYNLANGFADCNMHCSEKQKWRFGKLYFHEMGRGGVDICLSCGEYYLSLLIKNSLVTHSSATYFCRQTQLEELLKRNGLAETEEYVLKKRNSKKDTIVFHTVRKGLVKDNCFKNELLASVTGFEMKDSAKRRYKFDLEKGYTKEYLICEYIQAHPGLFTESEFKEKFLDYVPKQIREIKGLLR